MTVIDPMCAPEFYASGMADPEDMGDGNVRFTMFAYQTIGGERVKVAVAKIVCSMEIIPSNLVRTAKCIGMTWHGGDVPIVLVN